MPEARGLRGSAGVRWAALDFGSGDGPSVDQLGIDYAWPEPGVRCMNVELSAQLYWPRLTA